MTADLLWAGDSLQADAVYYAGERRSECSAGCPSYVVRCAHLDGDDRVVWMITPEKGREEYRRRGGVLAGSLRNAIFVGIGIPGTPLFPEAVPLNGCTSEYSDSRAEADRAFRRFEAVLLGREPDPYDDPPPSLQEEARWRDQDYTAALARQEARRRGER